jgi:hypothetical protein
MTYVFGADFAKQEEKQKLWIQQQKSARLFSLGSRSILY